MLNKRVIKEEDDVEELINKKEKPTTYLNDYKQPKIDPELDKKYRKINEIKGMGTTKKLSEVEKIPFDFFIQPKAISQPFKMVVDAAKAYQFMEIDEKEKLKRPRIYKCPEVSLDDIPEKEMRDKIIEFVYTSEAHHAMKDTLKEKLNTELRSGIKPPQSITESFGIVEKHETLPTQKKVINPKHKINKPLDCETDACYDWQTKQPRFPWQPHKMFWTKQEVQKPEYNPLEKSVPRNVLDQITTLMKENKLRYPHTITDLTYSGYRPRNTAHIPLQKIQFEPQDFWFTSNQYYGQFYLSKK